MSQLDQPLLGHRAAPGEGTGCAHLCHLPQGWLLFALDFSLSVVIGRTQDDYGGCQGTRYMGVGAENSPALPRSAILASQREGLLRAEHLSFLSELWPDTCSTVKDETPEAEVGGVRGGVCPHTPLLGAKPCGSFLARPRLQSQGENQHPSSAGEIVPVSTQVQRPSSLPQNRGRQQSNMFGVP